MRLKGLRITRKSDTVVEVVPLFYSKRGGTQAANHLKSIGAVLADVIKEALTSLVIRGDLGG